MVNVLLLIMSKRRIRNLEGAKGSEEFCSVVLRRRKERVFIRSMEFRIEGVVFFGFYVKLYGWIYCGLFLWLQYIFFVVFLEGKCCFNRFWGIFLFCIIKLFQIGRWELIFWFVMNEFLNIKKMFIDFIYGNINYYLNFIFYG